MNRLINLLLKMPMDVFVDSMSVLLKSLQQVNREWQSVSDEILPPVPRGCAVTEPPSEPDVAETKQPSAPENVEMLMNHQLVDQKFGTQDLGNDRDIITLIDFTVSYVEYDEEVVLHEGKQILKPEIRAGQVEREIYEKQERRIKKGIDEANDAIKEGNKVPKNVDTEDLSIDWHIVRELTRDKPDFDKDRNDALSTGTDKIVDAIKTLGDRFDNGGKAK